MSDIFKSHWSFPEWRPLFGRDIRLGCKWLIVNILVDIITTVKDLWNWPLRSSCVLIILHHVAILPFIL